MKKTTKFVVDNPKLVVSLTVLITVILGFYSTKLVINDEIINYLPEGDPDVETIRYIGDTFGGNNIGVVVVETDDVFDNDVFRHIEDLTDAFKKVKGVSSVTSLTNVMDMRSEYGDLVVGELVEEGKTYTSEELAELKEYVLSNDLYVGNIVSENCKYAMFLITLAPDAEMRDVVEELREVREVLAKDTKGTYKYYESGAPFMGVDADDSAKADLRKFLPASVLVILLVLYVTFRKLRGTILPLITVVMAVVWTMGLMVLFNQDLAEIGIAIPVVLVATGSAYGIHVMSVYYSSVTDDETKKEKLGEAIDSLLTPLLLSSVTTIIGFLSLVTSELSPIKQFGTFTAFGIFTSCLLAATFLPSLLILLPYKEEKDSEASEKKGIFYGWAEFLLPRSTQVILIMVILLVGSFFAIRKINYDTDFAAAFKEDDPTKIAMNLVNDNFGGISIYQILFEGDMKSPFTLSQMDKLENYIKDLDLSGTLSYADLIKEANEKINGVKAVPKTRDQVSSLGLFLEGQEQLNNLLKNDYSEGLLTARYSESSSRVTEKVNDKIRAFVDELDKEAFAISRDTEDAKLRELANETLKIELTEDLAVALNNYVDQNEISLAVENLIKFSLEDYVNGNEELDDLLLDILDPDYLGFELENLDESIDTALYVLGQGGDIDDLIDALLEVNPNSDEYDVEDAAYEIWDEINFEYFYARNDLVELVADDLAQGQLVNDEELLGILNNAFVTEVYVSDLPNEYQDHYDVRKESFTITVSGLPVLYEVVTDRVQESQRETLSTSLILVVVLLMIQLRSFVEGLMVCIPIILTVIFNFAYMALRGINLDVATTMIASVAIGTGVDYSIHFASRFRENFKQGANLHETLVNTVGTIGKPVSANAFAVAMGMLVLALSSTVTVATFGKLVALSMIISGLLALVLLPSLFMVHYQKREKKEKQSM